MKTIEKITGIPEAMDYYYSVYEGRPASTWAAGSFDRGAYIGQEKSWEDAVMLASQQRLAYAVIEKRSPNQLPKVFFISVRNALKKLNTGLR